MASIPTHEIAFEAIRAQGPGGQNVNKVSNAIQLRFDVRASSLPEHIKQALLSYRDQRITDDGVVIIKAQRYRSLEQNRADALERLHALLALVSTPKKKRRATKPTKSSQENRLQGKSKRSSVKALRGKVEE